MHSEAMWSNLDDRPVFVFDPAYNAHLCYWSGIAMTRSFAAIIIGQEFWGILPTRSVVEAAWQEHARLCLAGAYGDVKWHDALYNNKLNFHRYLQRCIKSRDENLFERLTRRYTPEEALLWLLSER